MSNEINDDKLMIMIQVYIERIHIYINIHMPLFFFVVLLVYLFNKFCYLETTSSLFFFFFLFCCCCFSFIYFNYY
jgi:hypothetical protein